MVFANSNDATRLDKWGIVLISVAKELKDWLSVERIVCCYVRGQWVETWRKQVDFNLLSKFMQLKWRQVQNDIAVFLKEAIHTFVILCNQELCNERALLQPKHFESKWISDLFVKSILQELVKLCLSDWWFLSLCIHSWKIFILFLGVHQQFEFREAYISLCFFFIIFVVFIFVCGQFVDMFC